MHNWLMRNVGWYREWHKYKYCQIVHYFVFLGFAFLDVYLIIQFREVINLLVIS